MTTHAVWILVASAAVVACPPASKSAEQQQLCSDKGRAVIAAAHSCGEAEAALRNLEETDPDCLAHFADAGLPVLNCGEVRRADAGPKD